LDLGVRHVLKRVTRRGQVFRLHTVATLHGMEKTTPPVVSTRVSVDVFFARLIGVHHPCGGADACGDFRVAKRVHSWRVGHLPFAVHGGLRR
jgi:hypothetical protein